MPHLEQCQIPIAFLFNPDFKQNGQDCFCLCDSSTATTLFLTVAPYPALNLPADFTFFVPDPIVKLVKVCF